eukprot:CAMPEP_0206136722 /NCGR_PEP_ID=MMETSP1473-20131121/1955_1 /ASSEMBLY_ACC=CAM_ASM_001109 /TAXON_ID=1461547 /ORGANISM="Stichococcus sp, Strain RCC1054" /LENGTH=1408 /DNA_ID=CAMNT_0053529453 /DNA_START=250 /DNA_END=4476 /DNA_ORIENTATION=-
MSKPLDGLASDGQLERPCSGGAGSSPPSRRVHFAETAECDQWQELSVPAIGQASIPQPAATVPKRPRTGPIGGTPPLPTKSARAARADTAGGACQAYADHCRASQWPSSMTSAGPPPPVGQLRAQLQQQQMQQKLLELQTQQAQQAQAQFQALLSRNSACMQQSGQGGNYPSRGQIESWLPAELQQSLQQQQQLLPRETQELRGQKHLWQRGGLEEQCVHPPSQAPQLAPPSQLPMLPPPALGSDLSAAQHGALPSYALVQQLLLQGGLTHTSHVELPSQASSASLDDAADTAAAVAGTGGSPQPPFPLGHSLTELLAMVHSQQQQQQHVPPGLPLPYRLSQQQLSQALSLLPGQGLTGLSSQSQGLAPSNQNQSSLSGPAFQEQAPQLLQRPLSQQLSRYPAPLHGRHRSPSVSTWSPAGTVARSQKLTLSPTEMGTVGGAKAAYMAAAHATRVAAQQAAAAWALVAGAEEYAARRQGNVAADDSHMRAIDNAAAAEARATEAAAKEAAALAAYKVAARAGPSLAAPSPRNGAMPPPPPPSGAGFKPAIKASRLSAASAPLSTGGDPCTPSLPFSINQQPLPSGPSSTSALVSTSKAGNTGPTNGTWLYPGALLSAAAASDLVVAPQPSTASASLLASLQQAAALAEMENVLDKVASSAASSSLVFGSAAPAVPDAADAAVVPPVALPVPKVEDAGALVRALKRAPSRPIDSTAVAEQPKRNTTESAGAVRGASSSITETDSEVGVAHTRERHTNRDSTSISHDATPPQTANSNGSSDQRFLHENGVERLRPGPPPDPNSRRQKLLAKRRQKHMSETPDQDAAGAQRGSKEELSTSPLRRTDCPVSAGILHPKHECNAANGHNPHQPSSSQPDKPRPGRKIDPNSQRQKLLKQKEEWGAAQVFVKAARILADNAKSSGSKTPSSSTTISDCSKGPSSAATPPGGCKAPSSAAPSISATVRRQSGPKEGGPRQRTSSLAAVFAQDSLLAAQEAAAAEKSAFAKKSAVTKAMVEQAALDEDDATAPGSGGHCPSDHIKAEVGNEGAGHSVADTAPSPRQEEHSRLPQPGSLRNPDRQRKRKHSSTVVDGQRDMQICNGEGPPAVTRAFAATTTAGTMTTVPRQQAQHNHKDASTSTSPVPIDAHTAGSNGKAAQPLGPAASLAAVATAAQAVVTSLEASPVSRWVPAGHKATTRPCPDTVYAPIDQMSCPPTAASPSAHEQMIPVLKTSQALHELCSRPGSGGSQRIAPAHCLAATSTAPPLAAPMRREGRFNIPMAEQVVHTQPSQAQMTQGHVTHALPAKAQKAEAQQGSGERATPDGCRPRCASGSVGAEVQPMGAIDRAALLAHSTAALACSMAQSAPGPAVKPPTKSTTVQAADQADNPTRNKRRKDGLKMTCSDDEDPEASSA